MENFCKGLLLGMMTGILVGAVAVAKNRKLSGMVKEKTEVIEKKISDITEKLKEKEDFKDCNQKSISEECNCSCENN